MSHSVIRLATEADTAEMISLINAAFAIETFLDGTGTNLERLTEMMRKGSFLVAQDGSGKLLASVFVEVRGEQGYLGMLAVRPDCQGHGLGRAPAENFCRRAGCQKMTLDVLSLRPELPPFYRNLGYVENGTVEFLPSRALRPGLDCHCIVMSKRL